MKPLYLLLLLAVIGPFFRYTLAVTQACRLIGITIASPAYLAVNKNGHQDAVTPPEGNKWFFLALGLSAGAIGWLGIGYSWLYAAGGFLVWFLSGTIAQATILPKPESLHFVMSIFGSMSRRFADYERDGDKYRAMAMSALLSEFTERYGPVIEGAGKSSGVTSQKSSD
jgi:hypothetical protein